jgi:dihydroorotase-like cyclic amidohydrolase
VTRNEWLIRGVTVAGDQRAGDQRAGDQVDIKITDGVITEIGAGLDAGHAQIIDATGLIALPGLVDLHTHLREPGREDAETVETGTAAAALGGFTAVHAMANTEPVADTAGVVEQVWRLGREAGHADVQPVGAVTVGLEGNQLAELGAMADSAARVRVFSDDGKCVADPLLMRRALEYVKAFDGVIAQHAQDPRLTEGAQLNEGEMSGQLGLTGWPPTSARRCTSATSPRPDRSRSSDGPSPRAGRSPRKSLRTTCCSPTSSRSATTPSSRSIRRCAPPQTSLSCEKPSPMAPSTASRPTTRRIRWRPRRRRGPRRRGA